MHISLSVMCCVMRECRKSRRRNAIRHGRSIREISFSGPVRWAFLELGQTDRAMDFVHLDAGSEWAAWVTPYVYLSAGNLAQAREAQRTCAEVTLLSSGSDGGLHAGAAAGGSGPKIVREAESSVMMEPDPEAWYHVGALMAYCGQKDAALRLLKAAVQQNYCAYSALLEDPLLKDLRKDTAFNQVLTAGARARRR